MLDTKEEKKAEKKKKTRIKIHKTKDGKKFIKVNGKPEFLPDLGNNELIKWIVKHLTKKKKRAPRKKKEVNADAVPNGRPDADEALD